MWIENFPVAVTIAAATGCSIALIGIIALLQLNNSRAGHRKLCTLRTAGRIRSFDSRGSQNELLPRALRVRHLDPEAFARSQPLLFRQLLARCRLCNSKTRCERDLDCGSTAWPLYCPNGPTLNMIGALQGSCLSI